MTVPDRVQSTRLGIVGFGGAGIAHLSFASSLPSAVVAAVYDPDREAWRRYPKGLSKTFFTDSYSEFQSKDCDAWVVCSPDKFHAEQIADGCRRGVSILCEKPVADGNMAAVAKVALCRPASGRVAGVQHQMRFVPLFRKAREQIRAGRFGKVFYIEGYYVHDLRDRSVKHDLWRFEQNATPLVYAGCHFVDLFRWLLGEEAEEIFVMGNNIAFPQYPESDCNVVVLRFKSGIIAKLVVAFGAERPQDHSLRIYGTEASLENTLVFDKRGKFEVLHRPMLGTFRGATRNPLARAVWLARDAAIASASLCCEAVMKLAGQGHPYYGVQGSPFRAYEHNVAVHDALHNFVEAVNGREEIVCDLLDGCRTVATCCAGLDSLRSGQPVKLAPYLAGF